MLKLLKEVGSKVQFAVGSEQISNNFVIVKHWIR